ncbi:MAG: hemerythrin domain-containing protein [Streptosporangiales bacterium]|nr:hemerythrin domain-containing protein [Streptosporangiales bacterium]
MAAGPAPDLVDVIIADHREMEALFTELEHERRDSDPGRRRDLVDHLITELVRHAVAEEQYLYPEARAVLYDGDDIADRELDEHAAAEALMKRLEAFDVTVPEFAVLLAQLIKQTRQRVEEQEANLLPRLRTTCDPARLRELGERFRAGKQAAPTRPHPAVPHTPPADKILTPGTGLIDRLRDALTGRGS